MDSKSLAHTTWNCKYHIVFVPKYRRQVIYRQTKAEIGKILRQLCERKGVEIVEATACSDHIYMLVKIPPKLSVSAFMGYLKGKSSVMIFNQHDSLKYQLGNRQFWCRGYLVDTVSRNQKVIHKYIKKQLQEDLRYDQMSINEIIDPLNCE
ncbi:IS200/IS605 family transposase [Lysinibacillus sphaericus]|uniref:IS200/IS605 family transposase n=1 Tax=Lysinibacillus sphaericus TaxID=1421 RepID=UPI001E2CD105|nr:IS200/IS605 family transposase [Lysinibacillus sphaericus]UDK95417.1 IS200/IS605 family transposase [Lysinibacillus sphaericus]